MRASRFTVPEWGWFVTPKGHEDLEHAAVCQCVPRIAGLLVVCQDCGTVYGHLRDSLDRSPLPREKRPGA